MLVTHYTLRHNIAVQCGFDVQEWLNFPPVGNAWSSQRSAVTGLWSGAGPCKICYRSVCFSRLNTINLKHLYNVRRNFWTFLKNTLEHDFGDPDMQI